MSLSKKSILEIIQAAKESGATSIKADGFEITFAASDIKVIDPEALNPVSEEEAQKQMHVLFQLTEPTAEEIKYWHTDYYDVLVAQRIKREKQRKEHKDVNDGDQNRTA